MNINQTKSSNEKITVLLAEALHVPLDQVSIDLQFGDLPQWDSMGHMEVMILLEERFGVEINADTIAELTSVPAICGFIEDNQYD
ncbi:MAG: acyl carrier protein [Chloroflexota bacterium]|nr:acyl carrier protein [Chloroflexota bacterium]